MVKKETGETEILSIPLESMIGIQLVKDLRGLETKDHWGWKILNITYSESTGHVLWASRPAVDE